MKILLMAVFAFLVFAQCPNQSADKELALKEKELELKEKELELKEKAKEKADDEEEDKKKEKEKPAPAPVKKAEPEKKKEPVRSKGCSLSNNVQFQKGASNQRFKCELDSGTGNTKHRYKVRAEAGQDLTISFKSNDASYGVVAPDGVRLDNLTSREETIPLQVNGTWIVSVVLAPGTSIGDYTIDFKIK